ncbi:hypothetical protein Pint_25610 [Pistacia integerrima]|uniref:Uncharacterized protein n=1 Tax=Pistacia integerrima TaxID=434235 RepID=A0ACC0YEP2_9ROSI|nr:hypothetical protein Pint_25610 [Pistacia integerrima]
MQLDVKERNESSNLQLVPFDDSQSADKSMKQVPKAVEKVLQEPLGGNGTRGLLCQANFCGFIS